LTQSSHNFKGGSGWRTSNNVSFTLSCCLFYRAQVFGAVVQVLLNPTKAGFWATGR
jgi:hypothetical protein